MSSNLRLYLAKRILDTLPHNSKIDLINIKNKLQIHSEKNDIRLILPLSKVEPLNTNINDVLGMNRDNIIADVNYLQDHKLKYISFSLNKTFFINDVLTNFKNQNVDSFKINNIVIEHSSPNIAKPFHIGHLRSTIIGNFVSNINIKYKNNVTRLNYLGDWGTQIGFLKVGIDLLGYGIEQLKNNPIKLLYNAYVHSNKLAESKPDILKNARDIFMQLEKGLTPDDETLKLIRTCTIEELERSYKRLGVKFDVYHWESMYKYKNIQPVISLLEKKEILKTDNQGRKYVDVHDRKVPLIKSDGTNLYLMRDVAAAIDRFKEFNFEKMYYVVDNSQTDHFVALKSIIKQLNYPWADHLHHLKFGKIRGMSTRKGNAVFLSDILNESKILMQNKQILSPTTKSHLLNIDNNTADVLGVSCVIINDLKQRRQKDYEFDWNKVLQVQGDTGIKLQYTHCRLVSLEKNSGAKLPTECNPQILIDNLEAVTLITHLAIYVDVLQKTYVELEPCILVNYLFQLCTYINKALKMLQVKNQPSEIASQRLLMFHISRSILKEGMEILGLQVLNEM